MQGQTGCEPFTMMSFTQSALPNKWGFHPKGCQFFVSGREWERIGTWVEIRVWFKRLRSAEQINGMGVVRTMSCHLTFRALSWAIHFCFDSTSNWHKTSFRSTEMEGYEAIYTQRTNTEASSTEPLSERNTLATLFISISIISTKFWFAKRPMRSLVMTSSKYGWSREHAFIACHHR